MHKNSLVQLLVFLNKIIWEPPSNDGRLGLREEAGTRCYFGELGPTFIYLPTRILKWRRKPVCFRSCISLQSLPYLEVGDTIPIQSSAIYLIPNDVAMRGVK